MKARMLALLWTLLVVEFSTTNGKNSIGSLKSPTIKNKVKEGSPCFKAADCPGNMYCHDRHNMCLSNSQQAVVKPVKPSSSSCISNSNCSRNMYCHTGFQICLPIYPQPTAASPTKPNCTNDKDCGRNQYCHGHFKMCLDVMTIPTIATRTSTVRRCSSGDQCRQNEYCHSMFQICLVNHTAINTPKPSDEKIDCTNDQDCQTDEYCHNMSHLCLQLRKATMNSPTPSRNSYKCTSDDDCKITEFCHFLFSGYRHVARDPSRSVHLLRRRPNIFGICIPKDMKMMTKSRKSYVSNCSVDEECDDGKCCLKAIGVCMTYPLPGEICVAEKTDFSCPCYGNMQCVKKGRRWRRRKIERKMKFKHDIKIRIAKHIQKGRKYLVGKCNAKNSKN